MRENGRVSRIKKFDRKFGIEFLDQVPREPGVYQVYDQKDQLIYVGKAKNLRRRLGQYRNAKRFKKHLKMREIVNEGVRLEYQVCRSELDALAIELKWIQEKRPKWNVAGAFYFLYPMIGIRKTEGTYSFCYTTSPEVFPDFEFHGAFRSRWIVGEAFFSWMKLLGYVGHRVQSNARIPGKFAYLYSFRRLPQEWGTVFTLFLKGDSKQALEELILALVENAAARKRSKQIQECLNHLARFWRHEASRLAKVRKAIQYEPYPVKQKDRDHLFLQYGHRRVLLRRRA